MARQPRVQEMQKKAAELVLDGVPVKEAMLQAGYTEASIKRWSSIFTDLPAVKEQTKQIATQAARLTPDGYRAKLAWLTGDLVPGVEIPWPSYMEAMKLYAFCIGEYRKEGQRTPAQINIHIHKKEEIIEVEGREVDNP